MRNLTIMVLLFAAGTLFTVCSQSKISRNKNIGAAGGDNSRNSLDWDGAYRGILPCADCRGIQNTVYLNKDLSYRVKLRYLGKENNDVEYSGTFTWNTEGNTITLDKAGSNSTPTSYLVGENTLTQLDVSGKKNMGQHAADYILSKSNYAIVEKYWKLTELYGKPVEMDSAFQKEPHIILKDQDNRVNGNAGCNTISGYFEARSMNRISFTKMITTQMACPKMDIESQFLKALGAADNFNLTDDILTLNKGRMAPLARFKAVYMK